ncbi:hypothetical protein VT84_29160 [Gemmata sp. SH-PL17]|nr:hypothetical protein VT84_29160 [Gemmata sp. SH-PL17]
MRTDSSGTAAVICELLAAPGWRKALGTRAAQVPAVHSRERFFGALGAVWELHTFAPRKARFLAVSCYNLDVFCPSRLTFASVFAAFCGRASR